MHWIQTDMGKLKFIMFVTCIWGLQDYNMRPNVEAEVSHEERPQGHIFMVR